MTKDQIVQIVISLASNPMAIILIIAILAGLVILAYAQIKKDNFDLRTLITEDDGKLSIHKIGQLVALVLSSWGFVYLILYKEITEFYFMGFMGVWASAEALNKWIDRKGQ